MPVQQLALSSFGFMGTRLTSSGRRPPACTQRTPGPPPAPIYEVSAVLKIHRVKHTTLTALKTASRLSSLNGGGREGSALGCGGK
jgi:hypothetical protein